MSLAMMAVIFGTVTLNVFIGWLALRSVVEYALAPVELECAVYEDSERLAA